MLLPFGGDVESLFASKTDRSAPLGRAFATSLPNERHLAPPNSQSAQTCGVGLVKRLDDTEIGRERRPPRSAVRDRLSVSADNDKHVGDEPDQHA
jgi:hypothetical protein